MNVRRPALAAAALCLLACATTLSADGPTDLRGTWHGQIFADSPITVTLQVGATSRAPSATGPSATTSG
jgi:hypothetical protein